MFRTTDNLGKLRDSIDIPKLEQYISVAAPTISLPIKLQQFLHGQSNPTILITDALDNQYVLRKKPAGDLISKTAHAIEREYRVMNALKNTNIPVPTMYCICEQSDVIGTPFYIMQFLKGRIFTDPAMPSLTPAEKKACWLSATDTLARLHQVNVADVNLSSYGKHTEFYGRQLRTFAKLSPAQAAVKDSTSGEVVGPIPKWDELTAWFKAHLPKDRTSIVHGDFKIDNCVFHETESKVIGILDWELSTIGHPLSDLANLFQPYGLPANSGTSLSGFNGRDDLDGVPSLLEVQKYYREVANWDPTPDWTFAEAFAHLRLAVITQGIAARVARKQASSLKAVHHAQMFKPLGELAWLIINDQVEIQQGSSAKL